MVPRGPQRCSHLLPPPVLCPSTERARLARNQGQVQSPQFKVFVMLTTLKRLWRQQSGQDAAEYALLIVGIAMVIVAVLYAFSVPTSHSFGAATNTVIGGSSGGSGGGSGGGGGRGRGSRRSRGRGGRGPGRGWA